MSTKILRKLSLEFQKYNISKIESGASKKIFYRLSNNNKTFIVINFSPYKQEYDNYVRSNIQKISSRFSKNSKYVYFGLKSS